GVPGGGEGGAEGGEGGPCRRGRAAGGTAGGGAALPRAGPAAGGGGGGGGGGGPGRVVFNASSWARSDVLRVPNGAGRRLVHDGRDWPAVGLPGGPAPVGARDGPAPG